MSRWPIEVTGYSRPQRYPMTVSCITHDALKFLSEMLNESMYDIALKAIVTYIRFLGVKESDDVSIENVMKEFHSRFVNDKHIVSKIEGQTTNKKEPIIFIQAHKVVVPQERENK